MPSKGHVLLQPLWIEDLINVLLLVMEDPKAVNRIYSIGGMEPLSYREILRLIMNKIGVKRYILPVSPAVLRTLTLWIDQLFPAFPVSIFWLDHLAEDRTANLDSLPRDFGIMPARFHQQLDYLSTEISKRK